MIQQFCSPKRTKRTGISIIEVLTSIVVAMIGVFGVMVMIPFAISQAQQGLDQEKASSLALNAVSEYEIRNLGNTNRWARTDGLGALISVGNFSGRPYVVDPIGVADRKNSALTPDSGHFPFMHPTVRSAVAMSGVYTETDASGGTTTYTNNSDQNILMDRVTILDEEVMANGLFSATADEMSRRLSSHLFAWSSELVFNEPERNDITGSAYQDVEIAPPKQVLDVMADGTAANRQSLKEMEYIVVATPNDIAALGNYNPNANDRVVTWRNYFVVYKDRPIPAGLGTTLEAYDRIFEVTPPIDQAGVPVDPSPIAPGNLTPLQDSYRLSISGGDVVMTEVMPAGNVEYTSQRAEIRRGDWMMLINVTYNPTRLRYFKQLNFYKVVDADFGDANNNGIQDAGESWNISLQGPDFDFFHPIESTPIIEYFAPTPGSFGCEVNYEPATPLVQIQPSRTFAVHFPDVFTVFERTFR